MKQLLTNKSQKDLTSCILNYALALLLIFVIQANVSAQYTISYSDINGVQLPNNDIHSCQEVLDSIFAFRVVVDDDAADNAVIEIDFPNGLSYLDGSISILDQIGGLTFTTVSSGSSMEIHLEPADLNEGDEITIGYSHYANCTAINHQSSGGTFKDVISVSGDAGTVVEDNPALANYDLLVPAISLFNEGPITTTVGSTVTREITIVNGGLGFLKNASFSVNDQTNTNTISLQTANGTIISPSTNGAIHSYEINASIISQYGNGDDNLDNGEEIVLTRTYEVLSCTCPSSYAINWNCEGTCQESNSLPQETVIANTVPNLQVTMPNVDEDVCYDGSNSLDSGNAVIQVVKVENIGNGAAVNFNLTMHNFNPGNGRGRHYFSDEAWVVKNEAGAVINTMSNITSLGALSYYQADCSVSYESTDMRQDAVGLVIEPGESVYVEIPVYYNNLLCPNCPKGVSWHMFNGEYQYEDICENNTYVIPRYKLFHGGHNFQRYDIEMPTDVHDDECFEIDINYNRVHNTVGKGEASGGSVTTIVDLNNTGLTYQGGSTLDWAGQAVTVSEAGGMLRISLPVNVLHQGQLVIPVCVDCDLVGGGTIAVDFWHEIHYSNSCSSDPIIQECKTELFVLHCPYPCPEGGATPLDFDLERVTLGLQDLDDNGVPDNGSIANPADVEIHRAVNGDELKGTWDIHVYPNTVGPNANQPFEYVYVKFDTYKVNETCNPAEPTRTSYFDAQPNALATITPGDGSPAFTCTVSPTVDNDGIATYDLSNCKDSWEGGDKILLEAMFTTNGFYSKTGESLYVADNECYSSYIPNPGPDDQHYCDFYNDYMNIYNIWHSPYMPATQQILGCENQAVVYLREYINIQAWPVWFPREYRNFVMFDEYIVDWPSYMAYRPGSARFAGQVIPDSDVTQTGSQLIFSNLRQFYQPYGGSILPPDEITNNGKVTWEVDPTCDAQPVFTSRFTAVSLGNGVNTPSNNWNSHVVCSQKYSGWATFTYDAPIPFISGGGETQPSTNETCWEINLNNSSNSQDAENTWFYFEDQNNTLGNISVFQGSTQINANSNGFFQIGSNENSSSTNYTICADIESCGDIALELNMGFHCTTYPSSYSAADCVDSIILEGDPEDAEVQVVLDSHPLDPNNVCEEQVVILSLTSAQSAFLNDSYVEIDLPSGVSFVGDIEIEYPSGSGNWQSVSYTVSGGNYIINIEDHSGIGVDGLPGTSDDPNELNREINLRFVVTYPDTGEGIILSSFGQNPCGDDALNNGVTVSTADLDPLFPDDITDVTICPGTSFAWRDSTYAIAGTYEEVDYNHLGCAYFHVLYLDVYETIADIEGDTLLNCEIQSVDLTALPENFLYNWSTGESSQTISVTAPDTYYVSITDDNGCVTIDTIEIVQDIVAPIIEITDDEICVGENGTITASGGVSYEWETGETTESITVSPASTTTYVVTVTSENGCTGTDEATVSVNPLPNATIVKTRDILCSPNTGYIYAQQNYSGIWNNIESAEYIAGGAPCGDQYLHIIGDSPVTRIGDKENNIITGGASYTYSFQYRLTGGTATRARITFYDSSNTNLGTSFEYLDQASSWTTYSMVIDAPATATHVYIGLYVGINSVMDYDCVELTQSNGTVVHEESFEVNTPFYWEGPNGFKGASRGLYIKDPGVYTLTITDPDTGCQNSSSIEVFEDKDEPGGTLAHNGPLTCTQTDVTITASTAITNAEFEWSTGSTDGNIIVDTPGTYSVTITDPDNGCETELDLEIEENLANPAAAATNDGPLTCTQPNVTLSATPVGLSYEWSDGSTDESYQVSTAATYIVTVTDVNGCTATASTEVILDNHPPSAEVEDVDICIGEDGTLIATGGATYLWSTGDTTESITEAPVSTTSYTVTVTGSNGCTAIATGTITVNPLPNASIIRYRDITCSPTSGYILATVNYPDVSAYLNGSEYISGGAGCGDQYLEITGYDPSAVVADNVAGVATPGETFNLNFKYKHVGTGVVTARINYYNSSWTYISNKTVSLPVTTNWTDYTLSALAPANAANVRIGLLVRGGSTVSYDCVEFENVSGGPVLFENSFEVTSPYYWEGPNGLAGTSRGVLVYEPGTYYLTVTDPNTGCQNTGSIEVYEYTTPPDGQISQNGPLTCAQTEVNLTASSLVTDATFEWSTGATTATEVVTEVGTYTVTITDPINGCTTVLTTEVTEDVTPPSPTASNDGPLTCNDMLVTITALPAGLSYEWPDESTDQSYDVSTGGEYIVTVTDVNGCTATASSTVEEDLDPPAADAGADASQCDGESTQLQASGGVSYQWSPAENLDDPNISNPIAITNTTTTYVVTVTSVNGCTATDEIVISIDDVGLSVDSDATTCEAECTGSITIDVEYAVIGDFNLSYVYQGTTVNLGPYNSNDPVIITDLCAGDYSDFIVSGINNGCDGFWAGPITISEETVEWEHVTHTDDVSDCSGACDGSFTVDANFGMTGEFMVSYTFEGSIETFGPYNFAGDILFDDLCAGIYSDITITSTETGCFSVWPTDIVIAEPFPIAEIIQVQNDECQEAAGSTIVSISGGTSPYTVSWSNEDGSHSGTSTLNNPGNIELDGLIGGNTYCIEVVDSNGCSPN